MCVGWTKFRSVMKPTPQSLNVLLVLQLPRLHYVYRANGLAPTHKSDIV